MSADETPYVPPGTSFLTVALPAVALGVLSGFVGNDAHRFPWWPLGSGFAFMYAFSGVGGALIGWFLPPSPLGLAVWLFAGLAIGTGGFGGDPAWRFLFALLFVPSVFTALLGWTLGWILRRTTRVADHPISRAVGWSILVIVLLSVSAFYVWGPRY